MSVPDDGRVGAVAPDVDGDTSDRPVTENPGQTDTSPDDTPDRVAVDEAVDPAERLEKLEQAGGSEDAQGTGGGADPMDSDPNAFVQESRDEARS